MKKILLSTLLTLLLGFFALQISAQESGGASSTNVTTTTSTATSQTWYASPWVWVVGAAVFILLLVALLNNRGRDRSA